MDSGDVGASAPRALISLSALRRNASDLSGAVVDVRREAWGHGLAEVARILVDAGVLDVIADTPVDRYGLRSVDGAPDAGEALYGIDGAGVPAMTLEGTVLSTKQLLRGEGVSYGYRYRAAHDTHVALVTGGYAQGVIRSLGGQASALIAGRLYPIVGRVAMDVCMVEIGDADIARHAGAVYFGDPTTGAPHVRAWSAATGLSAAEIVTTVGLRATREWIA